MVATTNTTQNTYYTSTTTSTADCTGTLYWDSSSAGDDATYGPWTVEFNGSYVTPGGSGVNMKKKDGINPVLIFKLWKKKMTYMEGRKYNARVNKLKKLAAKYVSLGHNALSQKFMRKLQEEVRFCELYACGIKMFIQKSLIDKYKYKIRDGHIADTLFDKYTKVIPKDILEKKKKLEKRKVFDKFVIYHYYNEELEAKKEEKEEISASEREAMRDPILFGICNDLPDKLFFIGEWDDDYCDLTFDELISAVDIDEEDNEVKANPAIDLDGDGIPDEQSEED